MISVSYEISNKEVIDSYWKMLRNSRSYRLKIFRLALLLFISPMAVELAIRKTVTLASVYIGLITVLTFPFWAVYLGRVLAKKGSKTITLTNNGMNVSIGEKGSDISWKNVSGIEENEKYLFILSSAGNFMCIPKRAFVSEGALSAFKLEISNNA